MEQSQNENQRREFIKTSADKVADIKAMGAKEVIVVDDVSKLYGLKEKMY